MKVRSLLVVVATSAVLALAGCGGASSASQPSAGFAVDSNTLVFGVVPDSAATQTNYQPLMDYLGKKTGKTIQYKESTDYAALIEAAIADKVDVASFSGFTYITAKNNGAKISPISSIVTAEGQEPGYYSEAIVPVDSPITSLEGFKGKNICFVDPSSTSGYLFPSYNLLEAGIDPTKDVTAIFAGKHDISVQKVGNGECDGGFAEDSEVAKSDKVKSIAKTMVPGAPIIVNDALPADVVTAVKEALGQVTIDEIKAAGVAGADDEGFKAVFFETKPVTDEYYDTIRSICEKTQAKQCQK